MGEFAEDQYDRVLEAETGFDPGWERLMIDQELKALQYIRNADGPLVEYLREDFEPIGERLLDMLKRKGLVETFTGPSGDRVFLTSDGEKMLLEEESDVG